MSEQGAEPGPNAKMTPVNVIEGGPNFKPSNYASGPLTLTQAGAGESIASGATKLSIALHTVFAGDLCLIAFGTDEADAQANLSGTVGSEQGHVVAFNVDLSAAASVGAVAKEVDIPPDPAIDYFVIAENHAAPTGKLMVTQGTS